MELINKEFESRKLNISLKELFNDYINRQITFYTASFSLDYQSPYLIKKYGTSCIGISSNSIRDFCSKNGALYGNVIYKVSEQEKLISEIFSCFETLYTDAEIDEESYNNTFILSLTSIVPLLKSISDSDEREAKIVRVQEGKHIDEKKYLRLSFDLYKINIYRFRECEDVLE